MLMHDSPLELLIRMHVSVMHVKSLNCCWFIPSELLLVLCAVSHASFIHYFRLCQSPSKSKVESSGAQL